MRALCEACRKRPATSLSWTADRTRWYGPRSGRWSFTCSCTSATEQYYVMLRQGGHGFLDSPTVYERWSDHLAEKVWFDPDDFAAMLKRFEIASERASR